MSLFCECTWQDRVDACRVLSRLREKAAGVPWHTGDRTEYFSVVARSFSKRPPEGDDHVICLDADDLTAWHRRCRNNAGQDPVDTAGA